MIASPEMMTVQELTRYGFKANNEYINWHPDIPQDQKGIVVPGGVYQVTYTVNTSGKKYATGVTASKDAPAPLKAGDKLTPTVTNQPVKQEAVIGNSAKGTDWAAKDRSQLIGGLSHDAAELTVALVRVQGSLDNTQAILAAYKEFLEGLIQIRNEVK